MIIIIISFFLCFTFFFFHSINVFFLFFVCSSSIMGFVSVLYCYTEGGGGFKFDAVGIWRFVGTLS